MKTYDIVRAEQYKDKQGNMKTGWKNVGEIIQFDGKDSMLVKLNMFDGAFQAFPKKQKGDAPKPSDNLLSSDFDSEIPF